MDALVDPIVAKAMRREALTRDEARTVLAVSDAGTLELTAAVGRVRRTFFGDRVKLNYLVNMKSGLCPEDCFYCSQRKGSDADVLKYSWQDTEEMVRAADKAVARGARRVCLVASGRGPAQRDIDRVGEAVREIASRDVEVCVCLGLLKPGQAEQLREAGAFAYNHNLNTSAERYGDICTTHGFQDRVDTVNEAAAAGLSPCSGAIFGMGEGDDDVIDVAFALRELNPDSVPVNFLIPFEGTPLARRWELTPLRCLRILALFRLVFPDVEVRLAGGREIHLRSLQPLALHVVNSIFLGDYLTSEGQAGDDDLRMIADAGFVVEGAGERPGPDPRHDLVVIRDRGIGTDKEGNT
ncbi:biotin synthase BioB [Actinoallomurus purpureus]|uniref:biotin synthase BioB n=1 Tax=Actinoallomurus purpureus TaxID=478114 RepID=UPI0020924FF7|nr:biotin synthase BioB [Actinoallomurus purpureus]MCO6007872.1 biotin synthase BioB [Actinoallomurus purpureus]